MATTPKISKKRRLGELLAEWRLPTIAELTSVLDPATLAPPAGSPFTGVTNGELLRGVDYFGNGARTHSIVMTYEAPQSIRFVDTIHIDDRKDLEIRL